MRTPKYKGLVDTLADRIRSGALPAGTRLPTHRELAAQEGIALVTASRVYAELAGMGLVSREQGRGTFVRDLWTVDEFDQQSVAIDAIDLSFNSPSVPGQADLLRQGLRDLAAAGDLEALLRYQPYRGRPQDREAVAKHLRRRGLTVGRERVLIVNGAQHGLAVTAMAMFQPGDVIAVDAITYPGFITLARTLGLDLAPLPASLTAVDPDAFEQLCRRRRVRGLYAIPTVHNPLGWTLPTEARERLVAIARRYNVTIIEDASYAYLAEEAPPPLATLAPELTLYVSGLSKSVATGLRVGYVVAPEALVPAVERVVMATTWHTPGVTAAIACRWLEDGTVDRLEVQKRADARERQAITLAALGDLPSIGHSASYIRWLLLPTNTRPDRIVADLARRRIAVSTAAPYAATPVVPQALRLAIGSVPLADLKDAVEAVRETVERDENA